VTAAAAAAVTGAAHRQLDGQIAAGQRRPTGDVDRDLERRSGLGPDEGVAHPLDCHREGRKVDAGLVGEAGTAGVGRMSSETIDTRQRGRGHEPGPAFRTANDRNGRAGCQGSRGT
jgi:hypothetical protein